MADQKPQQKPKSAAHAREDRLKAALKANMARRKAQARARDDGQGTDNGARDATKSTG